MTRPHIETWISDHPGLARIDGALVVVPQWMLDVAYRPILTHNPRDPIVPGMWDDAFGFGDLGLESLIREFMTSRPVYLWRPGDPCPHADCDGAMELERHVEHCSCFSWEDPCQVCLRQVFGHGGNIRPWIVCDTCDWMEEDGGVSNHAKVAAQARAAGRVA